MNRKQQRDYDATCEKIIEHFGSTNAIAIHSHQKTNKVIAGETIRVWMRDRKIPWEFVFILHDLMLRDAAIDPLTLIPELRRWVTLRKNGSSTTS